MAQARETGYNPTSPHSSTGGADSYNHDGTPDTRLTAFSPDESSARSNKLLNAITPTPSLDKHDNTRYRLNPEAYSTEPGSAEKDPFISSTRRPKTEQKLSPTASDFRPVSNSLVAHGSRATQSTSHGADRYHVISRPLSASVGDRFSFELGISRYVVLSRPDHPITAGNVEEYIVYLETSLGVKRQGKHSTVQDSGKAYIRLTNVKYAQAFYKFVAKYSKDWQAAYITEHEFYQIVKPSTLGEAVPEGVVHIAARAEPGTIDNFDPSKVEVFLINLFQDGGMDLFAFRRHGDPSNTLYEALVEFEDLDVAVITTSNFNGGTYSGLQLWLSSYDVGLPTTTRAPLYTYSPTPNSINDITSSFQDMSISRNSFLTGLNTGLTAGFTPGRSSHPTSSAFLQQQQLMYPVVYQSQMTAPTGNYVLEQTPTRRQVIPSFTPLTPLSSAGMSVMSPIFTPPATPLVLAGGDFTSPRSVSSYRYDNRRQNAQRVTRSPYHTNSSHHNQVDVGRIRDGIDVRTTIMLRNIPNKVDQALLKSILDESSWGKYDFMYLRIDFANNCNVGYAFVNFVDPLDIINFVNMRANKHWNFYKSEKVAEVSYATIQGKDCLVQKFRNSSVMLELDHYRPKLYYTLNGPHPELAGQEEPFPEPDNQSKMKRSCENAEHVGLFTPNAGQHFRDEQRRRRSRFDRGTRLAALEECQFDETAQHQAYEPAQHQAYEPAQRQAYEHAQHQAYEPIQQQGFLPYNN